ncbi:septum formation protein [Acinetobacter marinus]|uniref:dTTP/UTP pyrophosphatase n=1 Tax=Acinetobacter marinus TaxID=281375 RepID=A0A1G6HMT6_9GAMM|nr:nucleoside triphosphate pyrophosphatase [Acinetobacter marinus]SDB95205.1 septum formation protein [Acinetobacter marinus]
MASRIILASASPRRKELLEQVGVTFDVAPADVDETQFAGEHIEHYVKRVAIAKAQAILSQFPDATVIAADTTVGVDQQIFTKPMDEHDALRMWRQLSGRDHVVKTTVVIAKENKIWHDTVSTLVYFKVLDDAEMRQYWQTGEPCDKAAGYAIQGRAAAWVTRIEGSYSNVVGLPLFETLQLLEHSLA